jgi:hypothetical protein
LIAPKEAFVMTGVKGAHPASAAMVNSAMADGNASIAIDSVAVQPSFEVAVTEISCAWGFHPRQLSKRAQFPRPMPSAVPKFQSNVLAKTPSAERVTSNGEQPVLTEDVMSTVGLGCTETNCEVDAVHSGVVTTNETL